MKKYLYRRTIELTNGRVTSGMLRRFSRSSLSRRLIPSYIRTYRIDASEAGKPAAEYTSLLDFFTRTLHPDTRPIADTDITSPVDAKVEAIGDVTPEASFTVKGIHYSLTDLLGSPEAAKLYGDGKYIVLYLSPADYHRIHSPADGRVTKQYTLGRKSYPVNAAGLTHGKEPISGNYRMISFLESTAGAIVIAKVGAMFVNSIELTQRGPHWRKGEEIGQFAFGSTVVLFFENGKIEFAPAITAGNRVKVGEALAHVL